VKNFIIIKKEVLLDVAVKRKKMEVKLKKIVEVELLVNLKK